MPLRVNDPAPDFSLPSTDGSDFSLSKDLNGEPCILYFYPKDFTSVCTKEACSFRDNFSVFDKLDITIFGISTDSIISHKKFRKKHQLPFHLLSDLGGTVSKSYKALIPIIGLPKRVTYLIDKDLKISAVYDNMFGAEKHISNMVKKVKSRTDKRVQR